MNNENMSDHCYTKNLEKFLFELRRADVMTFILLLFTWFWAENQASAVVITFFCSSLDFGEIIEHLRT